jgi:hypothetical protein
MYKGRLSLPTFKGVVQQDPSVRVHTKHKNKYLDIGSHVWLEERWLNGRRRGGSMVEERWLNGSAPDCKSVVLGSNPAPSQHTANSVSPQVGSHLG